MAMACSGWLPQEWMAWCACGSCPKASPARCFVTKTQAEYLAAPGHQMQIRKGDFGWLLRVQMALCACGAYPIAAPAGCCAAIMVLYCAVPLPQQ